MNKICKVHGEIEPNIRGKCKKCASEAVSRRRRLVKIKAIKYKGGECSICKYSKCAGALDFHHNDPTEKDFSISRNGHCRSWKRIKEELDKCSLICRNCHAELHIKIYKENNPELDKRLNNFNENLREKYFCKKCKIKISSQNIYCIKCFERQTKIQWPKTSKLIQMIKQTSYSEVGRTLNVSDNAVKKRIKNH